MMHDTDKIILLTETLNKYCDAYYNQDAPLVSDREYDELYDQLAVLEQRANFCLATSPTQKVQGKVLDQFYKVKHSKPMLSAQKTKDVTEIEKFVDGRQYYCSYKLDGLTLVLRYDNGNLIQAVTRGTGTEGEDVTEQAKMIGNLPLRINYYDPLELRGECVVSWDDFKTTNDGLDKPFSHPRNMAAGSLRQFDPNITKQRHLSFVAFEVVTEINSTRLGDLAFADQLGFESVQLCVAPTAQECVDEMPASDYCYPVDGLIFELDDKALAATLPSTAHHEGCRIAYKWADDIYHTTLLDIEWSTSRTGVIAPVAVFEPVDLDGAMTSRATLHNVDYIKQLQLGIGDQIGVYRSNMVIPRVEKNFSQSDTYKIPSECPCCHAPAIIEGPNLICTNSKCSAKIIGRLEHFASRNCMNIVGLSEQKIRTLCYEGLVHDLIDLYFLTNHYDQMISITGFGKKSCDKLLEAIEVSRNTTLDRFICAIGIPNVGVTTAKDMASAANNDISEFLCMAKNNYDWSCLEGVGAIVSDSIITHLCNNYPEIEKLSECMNFIKLENKQTHDLHFKFCITGSFSVSRNGLKKALEAKGAKAMSSVSKNTDVLFVGAGAGSKLKKAQDLGIRIMNEQELMELLNN